MCFNAYKRSCELVSEFIHRNHDRHSLHEQLSLSHTRTQTTVLLDLSVRIQFTNYHVLHLRMALLCASIFRVKFIKI